MKYSQYVGRKTGHGARNTGHAQPSAAKAKEGGVQGPGSRVKTNDAPAAPSQKLRDRVFYVMELASEECACGRPQRERFSFCVRCYNALPTEMKKTLWQRVGQGYEQAYETCHKWLTENFW